MESSDKHGPRKDEAMARETEALVRSGRTGRTEEWRDPEPSGEDQPEADRAPNATLTGAPGPERSHRVLASPAVVGRRRSTTFSS